jgi:hypothetical protein
MTKMRILKPEFICVEVPPGKYVLGDPCYVVPDSDWINLLDSCDYFEQPIGNIQGRQILAFSTAYGDGTYQDNQQHEYLVDSGHIGLVPFDYAVNLLPGFGRVVEFTTAKICKRSQDGVLIFGPITINTNVEIGELLHDEE